jgi:hypothetical protein
MRLRLEADPNELVVKGDQLIAALTSAFADVHPDLADRLHKAMPEPDHGEAANPVIRELAANFRTAYDKQMALMLKDIGRVLDGAVREVVKGGEDHDLEKARSHKYISKKIGPNGKPEYTYPDDDKEGLSVEQRAELLREMSDAPTPPEKESMYEYQTGGYAAMNALLRHGEGHKDVKARLERTPLHEIREHVRVLQGLITRHKLTAPMTVYRGEWFSPERLAKLRVGEDFNDKGFFSTSRAVEGAQRTWKTRPHTSKDTRCLFTVHMPEGQPALDMMKHSGMFQEEQEVLLPHGSKFIVRGMTMEKQGRTNYLHVVLEPMPAGA